MKKEIYINKLRLLAIHILILNSDLNSNKMHLSVSNIYDTSTEIQNRPLMAKSRTSSKNPSLSVF